MKRLFKSFIICLFILIFVVTPVAAAFTAIISVVESSGNSYDMVASNITANIDYMADNGYFGSTTGLDTRVQEGTSAIPHMLVEDRILFANDLNAFQSKNYNFTTDNSLLPAFDIIGGYNSSINVTDVANIELGDNFTVSFSGYVDTDNGTDKYILEKENAFSIYISDTVNGNITSAISGSDRTPTVASSGAWANPGNTVDTNTTTYAEQTVNNIWTDYLVFNTGITTPMTAIEYWYTSQDGAFVDNFESDAYYGGGWNNVHTGVEGEGSWITDTLASPQIVSQYRLRWHTIGVLWVRCYEVRADYSLITVSATGVTSGEYEILTGTNNDNLYLGIGIDTNVNDANFPITDGLVFNAPLWHTELNSSPFTSKDTNEYSCTVTGAVWSSTNGYTFDGNDKITLPARWEVAAMTMEAWVYPTGTNEVIMTTGSNTNYSSISNWGSLRIDVNGFAQLGMGYIAAAYRLIEGSEDLRNGWHHIVGTGNATGSALIVDGVEVATSGYRPNQGVAFDTNSAIGLLERGGLSSNFYNGIVGEARIYTQRFTTGEALTNYNATKWKYDGSVSNIPFYYNLLGVGVPDNSNDYILFQNDVMPYADNMTIIIGGTQQLYFQPNDIIALSGINGILPDRQGGDNDGTITFGSNPAGIALSLGALISDYSGAIIDTTETPSFVPAGITPQPTATAIKEAALVAHPFYPWVSAFNTTTTVGILFQFQFIYIAGALFAFAGTFTWIRNMFLSGGLFVAVIGLGVTQSVFDWWVLLLVIPVWIGLTIMENRQTI